MIVRLNKTSAIFGPLPKGTVVDVHVSADLPGEQETRIRARKMFERDHVDENPMEWDAEIVGEQSRYRIEDVYPYRDQEEDFHGLTLEAAATLIEDRFPIQAAQIIEDVEEGVEWPVRFEDDETGREIILSPEVG